MKAYRTFHFMESAASLSSIETGLGGAGAGLAAGR
jgi:hypothetical protein